MPNWQGIFGETFSVATSAGTVTAQLTGTGTGAINAQPLLSPNPLAFGYQAAGTTNSPQNIWFFNDGLVTLSIVSSAFSTSGEGKSYFALASAQPANSCVPSTANGTVNVAAGASCAIALTYSPSSTETSASDSAEFAVMANGYNYYANLTGTVQSPATLSPPSYNYGDQAVSTSSGSEQFVLTKPRLRR